MLSNDLSKPRILVVEDNWLVADAICELVRNCGCDVAGSIGHVDHGMEFLADRTVDGAIVDINLHGAMSYPICYELQRRNVPFFFLTGYPAYAKNLPAPFRDTRLLTKPLDARQFKSALAEIRIGNGATEGSRPRWGNAFLEGLSEPDLAILEPKLERVALREGQALEAAAQPVAHVHFIISGLVSLMARSPQGRRIEVSLVGSEGATGVAALLDHSATSLVDAVVQIDGSAWRMPARDLSELLRSHRGLQDHVLGHVHSLMAEIAETTLATGHGKIEQRLARWLLMAADRCGTDKLPVTHEQLSRSLAVRRSGITVALHTLESRHLIKSQRKLVAILDRRGLLQEIEGLHGWHETSTHGAGTPLGLNSQQDPKAH
jgi:CRP-like cAMP-binding protein